MNKYKEALNCIKEIVIDERADGYYQPKTVEHFYYGEISDLNELVEKATPKKIVKREEDIGEELAEAFDCERYITVEYCPICGEKLRGIEKYCLKCGQALDWSEDDEKD